MFFKSSTLRVTYICTHDHRYTVKSARAKLGTYDVAFRRLSYEAAFRKNRLVGGTYIFTDFDRLSSTELTAAAALYRCLKKGGARVVNDPAVALRRDELLMRLYGADLNSFRCYRPAANETPSRFPVFLRTISGHRGVLSDLLETAEACNAALGQALAEGYPMNDLVYVEFAAERNAGTEHYQKHAAFFIDGQVIPANIVNDRSWVAKYGERNLASAEDYAKERADLENYPNSEWVRAVFDCAQIAFGRVDFGMVKGVPQAYEINTNPSLPIESSHPNPDRAESIATIHQSIFESIAAIAVPAGPAHIEIGSCLSRKHFRRRLKRL